MRITHLLIICLILLTALSSKCNSEEDDPYIELGVSELIFTKNNSKEFSFTTNASWRIDLGNDVAYTLSRTSGTAGTYTIVITPKGENSSDSELVSNLTLVTDKKEVRRDIKLVQKPSDTKNYYTDKDVVLLSKATQGKGVDLIIIGDGFVWKDLRKGGSGKYEASVRKAADYFFTIEPYKSHKAYFNVYMVVAESEEEGLSGDIRDNIKTKFGTKLTGGTGVSANYQLCREYTLEIEKEKNNSVYIGDLTTILVLNSTKYAGTCWHNSAGYAIAMCSMSNSASPNDFEGIIHHEAGGHGFARLADEYTTYESVIPQQKKEDALWWQSLGFYPNIDFTDDLAQIRWKHFVGIPKYSNVGVYQGAHYYNLGVWRPEANSCMINNVPYYNAPSRWAMVSRIKALAGEAFAFSDFVNADIVDMSGLSALGDKAYKSTMPPLAPPIMER